jgi:hypothetical protein
MIVSSRSRSLGVLSIVECRYVKANILDEHRAEDSMEREAAHDSRAPLAIGNDSRRSFRSDTQPPRAPIITANVVASAQIARSVAVEEVRPKLSLPPVTAVPACLIRLWVIAGE